MKWFDLILERAVATGLLSTEELREATLGRDTAAALRWLVDREVLTATALIELMPSMFEEIPSQAEIAGAELDPTRIDAESKVPGQDDGIKEMALGHYSLGKELGRGGAGRVVEAFDRRLRRTVALKFLEAPGHAMSARFVREAQNQARVDHPNVCKVFEAGELEGVLFIAMQRVEGTTLNDPALSLTLEEKVRILRDIALGVHAANRLGLVHRDLKPSNVMVERRKDGSYHPYVMDFGVSREAGAAGMTHTGAVVGTPAFMAPEQVLGRHRQLDRRTDVYGLGATMHFLITGQQPFGGSGSLEVLNRILEMEPPALRTEAGLAPKDLQSIVHKCLEKDRVRRYSSMKHLAEDLDRYLDGAPVTARPTGPMDRLRRRAARRPGLSVAVAASVVTVLVFAGFAINERLDAQRQLILARRLGQEIERVEWVMRAARMAPLHSLADDREALQIELEKMNDELFPRGGRGWQRAAVDAAVGRGFLSLGDFGRALTLLQGAWNGGLREPEVALALGQSHLAHYERGARGADRFNIDGDRGRALERLRAQHLDPALALAAQAGESEDASFFRARLAATEDRDEEALAVLASAQRDTPWRYQADLIEADVHTSLGVDLRRKGDLDLARKEWDLAAALYQQASETGRSDPDTYDGLCNLAGEFAASFNRELQKFPEALESDGLKACERALLADPSDVSALLSRASLYFALAESRYLAEEDPTDSVSRMRADLDRVREFEPDNSESLYLDTRALNLLIQSANYQGVDPGPLVEESIGTLDALLAQAPWLQDALKERAWARLGLARAARGLGGD